MRRRVLVPFQMRRKVPVDRGDAEHFCIFWAAIAEDESQRLTARLKAFWPQEAQGWGSSIRPSASKLLPSVAARCSARCSDGCRAQRSRRRSRPTSASSGHSTATSSRASSPTCSRLCSGEWCPYQQHLKGAGMLMLWSALASRRSVATATKLATGTTTVPLAGA